MPLLTPNHILHICGNPWDITSTTILGNVMENQLGKAGTSRPEDPNWASLLSSYDHLPINVENEMRHR